MPNKYGERTGSDNLADFIQLMHQITLANKQASAQSQLQQQRSEAESQLQQQGKQTDLMNKLKEMQASGEAEKQMSDYYGQKAQDLKGQYPGDTISVGSRGYEISKPNRPLDPTRTESKTGTEAIKFRSYADKQLQPFADQLNAAKGTLDNLDLNTPQGFKLAMINEARLAAGQGGSRAISSILRTLTGKDTSGMKAQDLENFINNTQIAGDAYKPYANNLRDAVISRVSNLQSSYNQTKQKVKTDAPAFMPVSHSLGQDKQVMDNSFGPVDDVNSDLAKRNTAYVQSKTQAGGQAVPPPQSVYSPVKSNLDKLKSFIGFGPSQSAAANQPPQQSAPATARYKSKTSGQIIEGPAGVNPGPDYDPVQ